MIKSLCFLILILFAFSCRQSLTGDIFIENVNIIDMNSGRVIPEQDVVINGNTLSHIHDHGLFSIRSETVLNGKNRYLIPGPWDMHIHTLRKEWYKSQYPLLRANGITGFREMWGDLKTADNVRALQKDHLPNFRFVVPGHILDGKVPFWDRAIAVPTVFESTRIVDSLVKDKVDFIKVYSYLEPEVFNAIAQKCKELQIPFSGHVPHTVWLTDASEAGLNSMEHLYGFLTEACSKSDSAMILMQQSVRAFEEGDTLERRRLHSHYHALVLNYFSETKLKKIARVLKRNDTHIVPTLAMLRGEYFTNDSAFRNDPRKKYMSDETLEFWQEVIENDLVGNTALDWQHKKDRWLIEKQIMRLLIDEKVPIMAGTDSDNPYAFPGFSLHDELSLYVELGMSPLDALRSATIVPVDFLKMSDSLGAIEAGKLADLVLLDANPLENIRNTTKINSVIANGRLFGKKYIDSVLHK